jgi:hypothetical protein
MREPLPVYYSECTVCVGIPVLGFPLTWGKSPVSEIRCPRLRQIPYPLTGHQDLPQYYVEVETILCGLQMNQMSCIERTLLQTMLKMLKKVNTNNVENTRKKNLTPNPRQAIPPVACLLSAKTNPQEEPSTAPAPGFVCGVARGAKNLCPQYSPY